MEFGIRMIPFLLLIAFSSMLDAGKTESKDGAKDEILNSLQEFSLKLHNILTESRIKNNLFYSPFSIATALAMIYEGTDGETKEELSKAFGWNSTNDVHRLFGEFLGKQVRKSGTVSSLSLANRIWVTKGMGLQPKFRHNMAKVFHSKVGKGNFSTNSDAARKKINDWVKQNTGNKILNFLKPGTIDSMTRLVLVNAIYFKAKWKTPFDIIETRKRKFFIGSNKFVRTHMMAGNVVAKTARGDNFTVMELPYKGKRFSMLIILPEKTTTLRDIEKKITVQTLRDTKFFEGKTNVILPKFKLKSNLDLRKPLTTMNIKSLFGPNCDLSRMFKFPNGVFVTQAFHKALVEVDEKGTKAAAATGLVSGRTFLPVFNVNRPFLFFIKDVKSDVILFTGRFVQP